MKVGTTSTFVSSGSVTRNLQRAQNDLSQVMERLSSGTRINRAGDDAARSASSTKVNAKYRSSIQAKRNIQDGISLLQTAEGGLSEIQSTLSRLRELAVQGANGGLTSQNRAALDQEKSLLIDEIDRISSTTEFNGKSILAVASVPEFALVTNYNASTVSVLQNDGSGGFSVASTVGVGSYPSSVTVLSPASSTKFSIEVGAGGTSGDRVELEVGGASAKVLGLDAVSLSTQAGSESAIAVFDQAIESVNKKRAEVGASHNRLTAAHSATEAQSISDASTVSTLRDANIAEETAEMSRSQILRDSTSALLGQTQSLMQTALSLIG